MNVNAPTSFETVTDILEENAACKMSVTIYSGADKSLAQPGRKQANVSVRMA